MDRILDRVKDVEGLALHLFPDGKIEQGGKILRTGDMFGDAGGSFVVSLDSGNVYDHNGGEGGDLIDVVKQRIGGDFGAVAKWLDDNGWLDIMPRDANSAPPPKARSARKKQALIDLPCAPADAELMTPAKLLAGAAYLRDRGMGGWDFEAVGDPVQHVYRWADGTIPIVMVRYFTVDGKKEVRRLRWGKKKRRDGEVVEGWKFGGTGGARLPLYRLPDVLAEPEKTVLIVEGEKAADAVGGISGFGGRLIGCSPPGGSNPAPGTDWSPLSGRAVKVLGDNDEPGWSFAHKVKAHLTGLAESVRVWPPAETYRHLGGVGPPPDGWDVADPVLLPPSCSICGRPIPVDWGEFDALSAAFTGDGAECHVACLDDACSKCGWPKPGGGGECQICPKVESGEMAHGIDYSLELLAKSKLKA